MVVFSWKFRKKIVALHPKGIQGGLRSVQIPMTNEC